MKKLQANQWWLRGWTIIVLTALVYELIAFSFELRGIRDYPTLSTILVTAIPSPVLDALTVVIALVLLWHWHDLRGKWARHAVPLQKGIGRELRRIWNDSGFPDDVEQYDFVTRDKRDGK